MAEPALVRDCLSAMCEAADITVTHKTRIGIDDMDSDQALVDFIGTVIESGIDTVILHARIAILAGLSPRQNREVPPLNYERPALIKSTFPELKIVINGGITSLEQSTRLLDTFDGVMLGREAYQHPWILSQVDSLFFNEENPREHRQDALQAFYPYIEKELASGTSLHHMTRHILGLFQGQPGARKFRRLLSENAWKQDAGLATLQSAADLTQTHPRQDIAC
jgi:tRNA-dihydrouridine synthase A